MERLAFRIKGHDPPTGRRHNFNPNPAGQGVEIVFRAMRRLPIKKPPKFGGFLIFKDQSDLSPLHHHLLGVRNRLGRV